MPKQARRTSKYDLVSFKHPPVAEVALSVQFAPETIDLEAYGAFAHAVRSDLPRRYSQPVLPPMAETFDRLAPAPSFEIHLDAPTSLPRTWFQSSDGVQLVQLQHDRLTLNWREVDTSGQTYPRYVELRARFNNLLNLLCGHLVDAGRPAEINLCEVTYVNPVAVPGFNTDAYPDLAQIINRVRSRPRKAFLPSAEDARLQARWRIPGSELNGSDRPAGRLYLDAAPGLKPPKGSPVYMVNLTGRLLPAAADLPNALEALDVGHKWVVLGFKDLTTTKMHKLWGLDEPK